MITERFTGGRHSCAVVARLAIHMSARPRPPVRSETKYSSRPSPVNLGESSRAELFTTDLNLSGVPQACVLAVRRATMRSAVVWLPREKNNSRPSAEMHGNASMPALLSLAPRFVAGSHASSVDTRVEPHRSQLPKPPGRLDQKYTSRPLLEMLGVRSAWALFGGAPIFTGVPKLKSAFVSVPLLNTTLMTRRINTGLILGLSNHFILNCPFFLPGPGRARVLIYLLVKVVFRWERCRSGPLVRLKFRDASRGHLEGRAARHNPRKTQGTIRDCELLKWRHRCGRTGW